nr:MULTISPECIES: hypothetical protein [Streptomyces]
MKRSVVRAAASLAVAGLAATAAVVTPAQAVAPAAALAVTAESSSAIGGTISRDEIIQRAKYWLGKGITYNQGGSYPDSGGKYYRTDCSGYVSMAWHLSSSLNTVGIANSADTYEISRSQLKAGDVLNSYYDHVILFEKWDDAAHTKFSYYSFGSTPVKHITGMSINASTIDGHPNGDYKALRYEKAVDSAGDVPVAANWDGGAADNVGIWRPSTGEFHLRFDDGSLHKVYWGEEGDVPVSANWDGSGTDNVGIWRPSTGEFHLRMDDGSLTKVYWGEQGDMPVSANWDGGAADNVGIWRPSTGEFHLRFDDGSLHKIAWGTQGDIPVAGNWDGSGADNVGIYRPSTGEFHLRMDDGSLKKVYWGEQGDLPVSANWDGGAPDNVGIWRPSTGEFHLRFDDGSLTKLYWGEAR